jgi:predicted helicase
VGELLGAGGVAPTNVAPMRTAVAFAQNIKASKAAAAAFPDLAYRAQIDATEDRPRLRIQAAHVDGTMGVHERNTHLAWLKEPAADGVCRVLTNARCLSEGVDVPALDAVLFPTSRGSQVDVVQSVGRVMRSRRARRACCRYRGPERVGVRDPPARRRVTPQDNRDRLREL